MSTGISARLAEIAGALPLRQDIRILEIGCGTGVMARHIADRIGSCFILGVDRSATSIARAESLSAGYMNEGKIAYWQSAIEQFHWPVEAEKFDLAVAVRCPRWPASER